MTPPQVHRVTPAGAFDCDKSGCLLKVSQVARPAAQYEVAPPYYLSSTCPAQIVCSFHPYIAVGMLHWARFSLSCRPTKSEVSKFIVESLATSFESKVNSDMLGRLFACVARPGCFLASHGAISRCFSLAAAALGCALRPPAARPRRLADPLH